MPKKPGDVNLPGEEDIYVPPTPANPANNNNIKYKEPSAKAKLARLKQDILGDGVKESKLEKYVELSSGGSGSNDLAIALIERTASEVVIPKGTTKIWDMAFAEWQNLRTVIIPNTVTYIGDSAFSGCTSLDSITIPSSVTAIDTHAFYGCEGLYVRCEAVVPPTLGSAVFDSPRLIGVPRESVDAYKAADGWSEYASSIEVMKGK